MTENTYSEDGKLMESFDGVYNTKTICFYDEDGRLYKKEEYDDENRLYRETVITDGKLCESYKILDDGSRELTERIEYNDRGQETRHCEYGFVNKEFLYTFDENGVETERKYYRDGDHYLWCVFKYDEVSMAYGKPSGMIFKNEDGSVQGIVEQKYSKKGERIREFFYNADGSFQDQGGGYIGKYMDLDAYGNPIREITVYGSKEKVVKEITYQPFIIPLQYLSENDKIMIELSKDQQVLK